MYIIALLAFIVNILHKISGYTMIIRSVAAILRIIKKMFTFYPIILHCGMSTDLL
jgi:hypothetical protein